jgi:hypothetical protein
MGQEGFNLLSTHIPGMDLASMVSDIAHDPITIGLFGARHSGDIAGPVEPGP